MGLDGHDWLAGSLVHATAHRFPWLCADPIDPTKVYREPGAAL